MKLTPKFVQEEMIGVDAVSTKRDGTKNLILRKGYFYGMSDDGSKFAEQVQKQLDSLGIKARIVDYGNHWAEFKGGAPIARQSHYWVEVAR